MLSCYKKLSSHRILKKIYKLLGTDSKHLIGVTSAFNVLLLNLHQHVKVSAFSRAGTNHFNGFLSTTMLLSFSWKGHGISYHQSTIQWSTCTGHWGRSAGVASVVPHGCNGLGRHGSQIDLYQFQLLEITNYDTFLFKISSNWGTFVLECPFYMSVRNKFRSLFENAVY